MRKYILLYTLILLFASCKKEEVDLNGIIVKNEQGQMEELASVKLFASKNDLMNDTNNYFTGLTNELGFIELPEDLKTKEMLYCKAEKGEKTSEFNSFSYNALDGVYTVVIGEPNDQHKLCGYGSKEWLMTSYKLNGNSQPYNVVSLLNSDGTWTDSNNNSGTWSFQNNNTQLVYDYTGSGIVVTFDIVEFTVNYISLISTQSGMIIEMEMTAI